MGFVDEVNSSHATLREHDRALHPGRASSDDENVGFGVCCAGEAFRVPSAPILLAHRCVLGASDRRDQPFLLTQKLQPMHSRMSSSRPSSILVGKNGSAIEPRAEPIKIEMAADHCHPPWCRGSPKRPTPTTGFEVCGLNCSIARAARSFPRRNRDARASYLPIRRGGPPPIVQVPEVDQVVRHVNELEHLVHRGSPIVQRIESDPHCQCTGIADRFARLFECFKPEARAVLQRAAVFIGQFVWNRDRN